METQKSIAGESLLERIFRIGPLRMNLLSFLKDPKDCSALELTSKTFRNYSTWIGIKGRPSPKHN